MRIITVIIVCTFLTSYGVQKKTVNSNATAAIEAKNEVTKIKQCFANYKSSILNNKGEEAVEYVDSRTIKYYQNILDKTKMADSTEINSMNIMDKFMVFSIRHRTAKEDILKFDGKQLLVYAIQEGMVGKNSVANNEIGDVEVDENFGKGQLIANGTPAPMYFHFYKEEGNWKIDLTSIFPVATQAFQKMAEESGEEENEYLFMLLEMITGNKPTNEIWKTIID